MSRGSYSVNRSVLAEVRTVAGAATTLINLAVYTNLCCTIAQLDGIACCVGKGAHAIVPNLHR